MHVSIATGYLRELSPEEMVRAFAGHGWQWLELSHPHQNLLLERGDPVRAGDAFRKFAGDHGISFKQGHFLVYSEGPPGQDGPDGADTAPGDDALFEVKMERMKRWVDLFAALGIEAGVYHHGGWDLAKEGWSQERILARRREGIERMCGYARGTVTRICVENLPGDTAGYEELRPLVEFLPGDEIRVCLDTGHANMEGVDCAGFVRAAGDRLAALHVQDTVGEKDDHIMPYGRGTIHWDAFLAALRETTYQGLFNFELGGEALCHVEVRLMKLDYIRELGEWMVARSKEAPDEDGHI